MTTHITELLRQRFESFWVKTRGKKKATRELQRHKLQPQTYFAESANRHWVTFQAATTPGYITLSLAQLREAADAISHNDPSTELTFKHLPLGEGRDAVPAPAGMYCWLTSSPMDGVHLLTGGRWVIAEPEIRLTFADDMAVELAVAGEAGAVQINPGDSFLLTRIPQEGV